MHLISVVPAKDASTGAESSSADGWLDARGRPVAEAYMPTPLAEALAQTYPTDAHFVCYQSKIRLNKPAADDAVTAGIVANVFVADLDRPKGGLARHPKWDHPDDGPAALLALRPSLPHAALYVTSGGLRVVQPLSRALPVGEAYETALRAWLGTVAPASVAVGLETDMSCAHWNQHYRLPHVMRDGEVYRSFLDARAEPIDPILPWLDAQPPAVEGHQGSTQTFRVACDLVRTLRLPPDDALGYLRRYSLRCVPPWSERELEHKIRDAAKGATVEDNPEPLLLVTSQGGAVYVRRGEDWAGPTTGPAIDVEIEASGIDIWTSERKRKRLPHLLSEYGARIHEHVITLGTDRSHYDVTRHVFSEACARPRALAPLFSPLADAFLRALGGAGAYADLCTWLAYLPDLTQTLAALVIVGPRGVGKSLFFHALSRLWSEAGPTPASEALGEWSGALLRCPLAFGDEGLPNGGSMTARIREFVQARSILVTRKYLPSVQAIGACRLGIAGNSLGVLNFKEALTADDVSAIAERFYVLRASDDAAVWHQENPGAARLLADDGLAKHALWLAANFPRTGKGRFKISGDHRAFDALALQGGCRSDLCRWLTGWLANPAQLPLALGRPKSVSNAGEALVSLPEIFDAWTRYVPDVPRPGINDLRSALTLLATPKRDHGGPRYWKIDRKLLETWIDDYA